MAAACSGAAVCGHLASSSFVSSRDVAALRSTSASCPSTPGYQSLRVTCGESRIGKAPITVPKGVTVKLDGQFVHVKGPLGELQREYPKEVLISDEGGALVVKRADETRRSKAMHGLCRTLASNMVMGVSTGFKKDLEMIGVGYRAAVKGNELTMNLGFSHPVVMQIPKGIKCTVENNTKMTISGYDKEVVGQFAASVRKWREPEPYKGKGIKYVDEVIRRKTVTSSKKK